MIRAQQFEISPKGHPKKDTEVNLFSVRIKARSYMGGEVRYFAEMETGTVIHIIGGIKSKLYRRGDEVQVEFYPKDCHLLPKD